MLINDTTKTPQPSAAQQRVRERLKPPARPRWQPKRFSKCAIALSTSSGFLSWLNDREQSLLLTLPREDCLLLLTPVSRHRARIERIPLEAPQALSFHAPTNHLYVSTRENVLAFKFLSGNGIGGGRFFMVQDYDVGETDAHGIVFTHHGPCFVNTRFSSIAALPDSKSLGDQSSDQAGDQKPWRPPFIDRLVPEDRCHLNGVTVRRGELGFATAFAACNHVAGWRNQMADGGIVIDCARGQIVATGLSAPHAPLWHEKTQSLWVAESGRGRIGRVDLDAKKFSPQMNLPGFIRSLQFLESADDETSKELAICSLSAARKSTSGEDVPLAKMTGMTSGQNFSGVAVIDPNQKSIHHWLAFDDGPRDVPRDVFDVALVPRLADRFAFTFSLNGLS